jgi:hypothetical protein
MPEYFVPLLIQHFEMHWRRQIKIQHYGAVKRMAVTFLKIQFVKSTTIKLSANVCITHIACEVMSRHIFILQLRFRHVH